MPIQCVNKILLYFDLKLEIIKYIFYLLDKNEEINKNIFVNINYYFINLYYFPSNEELCKRISECFGLLKNVVRNVRFLLKFIAFNTKTHSIGNDKKCYIIHR